MSIWASILMKKLFLFALKCITKSKGVPFFCSSDFSHNLLDFQIAIFVVAVDLPLCRGLT